MANGITEIIHGKGVMTSYGFGKFIWEFFNIAFGAFVFFYYESELGLASWLTSAGYIIFAIWNAVNDPLVGYLMDRPFKFTRKWGRRFPWVFIGGVPWILSYLLIFTPPTVDPQEGAWILFGWIVFTTCLYDFFGSIYYVSFYSIFPDKFRSESERRVANMLSTLIGALGATMGAIIPPLFITFGDLRSYIIQAGIVIIICFIALLLAIPGSREDQERIDCYLAKCEEGMEKESFFKEFKQCVKHKNFFAFSVAYLFYRSLVSLMVGSIPYFVQFVLKVEASDITLIMVFLLLGMFISIPLWMKIAAKLNDNRKAMIYASFFLSISALPLQFITNYALTLIAVFIFGIGEGGFWVMINLVLANAIDESVIMSGQRKEGLYNGFQTFLGRGALVVQAVLFAAIHTLTGFVEGSPTQTPEAEFGIQLHFSLFPSILMFMGAIILLKFYDLSTEKAEEHKKKLVEMGL